MYCYEVRKPTFCFSGDSLICAAVMAHSIAILRVGIEELGSGT